MKLTKRLVFNRPPYMPTLNELLNIPPQNRNEKWSHQFFQLIPDTHIQLLSNDPQTGPDHWPYLLANTSQSGEPALKVLHWLSDKGIGLIINPEVPDCVLSYGMIWNLRETGEFLNTTKECLLSHKVEFTKDTKILAGPPTEKYLPLYVRKILSQFFLEQGILKPQILIISKDKKHYDLCFSLESIGNPPESEHRHILEAFSWFFPRHYSLTLISERGLPRFCNLE